MKVRVLLVMVFALALALAGCSGGETETATETGTETTTTTGTSAPAATGATGDILAAFSADSFDGVVDREMLSLDADGLDGTPALLVEAEEPGGYRLFSTGDIDVEGSLIVYTAMVRSHDLEGEAMLEMWCAIPELGEFFSRGMDSVITGTSDWTELRTVFRLEPGQNPSDVMLNLVVNGTGRVWVDDARLTRAPLE